MTKHDAGHDTMDPLFVLRAANDRPDSISGLGVGDFSRALWRERKLMAGVFVGVLALGAVATLKMKTVYPAQSSVLVRLGDEYVYQPTVGDAGKGFVPSTPEQLIKSEIEILNSATLRERVLTKTGIDRLNPELGAEYKAVTGSDEAAKQKRREIMGAAVQQFSSGIKVTPAPNTPVIRLVYKHEDAQFASEALNRLIDEYLAYRREVLQGVTVPLIAAQRRGFENRLNDAQLELEKFLTTNAIGDFEGERKANVDLYAQVLDEYYRVQTQRRQIESRRDALTARVQALAPEINLYVDDSSSDKLLALKMERSDLLSRFTPDSPQVRSIDDRIAQLQRFLDAGQANGQGPKRVGINPIHQTLMTEQLQAEAEATSLREREESLSRQISQLSERQLFLQSLAPRYQQLLREKTVLESNAQAFAEREEETRASREISEKVTDNIRIIERPVPAVRGASLRMPVMALSIFFAAATALLAGALRVLSRTPLPSAARAPAASAASSHIRDLPILAALPMKVGGR